MSTSALIAYNVAYLEQALGLIDDVTDEQYTECRPPFFNSGIGEHLRHIVEHYQCFLAGLDERRIDYDGRKRDRDISGHREHARSVIRELIAAFKSRLVSDFDVQVRLDGSSDHADVDPWSRSTTRRELQYLQAHTVHHYALIAFILRLQGSEPSAEFGVAPSTLRHRRASEPAPKA